MIRVESKDIHEEQIVIEDPEDMKTVANLALPPPLALMLALALAHTLTLTLTLNPKPHPCRNH